MRAATLLLLPLLLLLLPPDAPAAPKKGRAEDPGRLLNLAQQQLARGEIEEAIDSLGRSIEGRPEEGYAWGLLAEAEVWGRARGVELVAAWEELARLAPDEGHRTLRVVRGLMALHRRDRFTNANAAWVQQAQDLIDRVLASSKVDERYAALIARRDLLSRLDRPVEALADGLAAWSLDKGPLQGRLSSLQSQFERGDAAGFTATCLDILRSDPWAVEACGGLFQNGNWEGDVEAARRKVLARVGKLEGEALADPVLANELLKFHQRRKDDASEVARFLALIRASQPDFVLADNPRWWRGTFTLPPTFGKLYADTNRANNLSEPAERLAALLDLRPDDAGDPIVQRWRWRVVEAALAVGPGADEAAREALRELLRHDPGDARASMELAALSPPAEALPLLQRAEAAVLEADWDPWEAYGGTSFAQAMERRSHFVADLQLRQAQAARALGEDGQAATLALRAAWAGPHLPEAWALVAELAAERGALALARDADGMWLAACVNNDGLPEPEEARAAIQRYRAAHPGARSDEEAWAALAAAATVRAGDAEEEEAAGVRPPESHPLVGAPAPSMRVQLLSGEPIELSALRGRVVVLDFWASWCGPCKRAMPELQRAADALADAPVTFLLVSVDDTREAAERYMDATSYTMQAGWLEDGAEARRRWTVPGIPSTFVLGPDGIVRHHHQGYARGAGALLEEEARALLSGSEEP